MQGRRRRRRCVAAALISPLLHWGQSMLTQLLSKKPGRSWFGIGTTCNVSALILWASQSLVLFLELHWERTNNEGGDKIRNCHEMRNETRMSTRWFGCWVPIGWHVGIIYQLALNCSIRPELHILGWTWTWNLDSLGPDEGKCSVLCMYLCCTSGFCKEKVCCLKVCYLCSMFLTLCCSKNLHAVIVLG